MKKGILSVKYSGGRWRQAVISFEDDREDEFRQIAHIMEEKYGWEIEQCAECGLCEVSDRDEYSEFMGNWKECKKIVRETIRSKKEATGKLSLVSRASMC